MENTMLFEYVSGFCVSWTTYDNLLLLLRYHREEHGCVCAMYAGYSMLLHTQQHYRIYNAVHYNTELQTKV